MDDIKPKAGVIQQTTPPQEATPLVPEDNGPTICQDFPGWVSKQVNTYPVVSSGFTCLSGVGVGLSGGIEIAKFFLDGDCNRTALLGSSAIHIGVIAGSAVAGGTSTAIGTYCAKQRFDTFESTHMVLRRGQTGGVVDSDDESAPFEIDDDAPITGKINSTSQNSVTIEDTAPPTSITLTGLPGIQEVMQRPKGVSPVATALINFGAFSLGLPAGASFLVLILATWLAGKGCDLSPFEAGSIVMGLAIPMLILLIGGAGYLIKTHCTEVSQMNVAIENHTKEFPVLV